MVYLRLEEDGLKNNFFKERGESRVLPKLCVPLEQLRLLECLYPIVEIRQQSIVIRIDHDEFEKNAAQLVLGSEQRGILNLQNQKYWVDLKVCDYWGNLITCELMSASEELMKKMALFLNPSFLGSQLRRIPSFGGRWKGLWFGGSGGTHLFVKKGVDGQSLQWTLYVLGMVIEWDSLAGFSTGQVRYAPQRNPTCGIFYLQNYFLIFDSKLDLEKLEIAKKVILSSNLSQELKNGSLRQIKLFGRSHV